MIITSDLIQCSPSRLTMQMSVSPVHPSRLSRIVKTPEINSTHRDLILIQILVSNSKNYSRTSILNFRANIGFTPSSRVYTGRDNFKVPPHSPSDKVLGDFTKSLLRYLILKLVICTYLLYLLEHFPACTNT